MLKAFLIQPMNGRKEREIIRERELMKKVLLPYDFEVIDTYFIEKAPEGCNEGLFYLGKSIQAMGEADLIICLPHWRKNKGCRIEYKCAKAYKKNILRINLIKG